LLVIKGGELMAEFSPLIVLWRDSGLATGPLHQAEMKLTPISSQFHEDCVKSPGFYLALIQASQAINAMPVISGMLRNFGHALRAESVPSEQCRQPTLDPGVHPLLSHSIIPAS
jgi:hypothetical protein